MGIKTQSLSEGLEQQIFCNQPAPNQELRDLSNLFVKRTYPRNKMLVRTGERWQNVYFIHQGLLRLFYTDAKGREFNKGFFWEDQFV